jgi:hypothetical protein
MKQQQVSATKARALAAKAPLAVVAIGEGAVQATSPTAIEREAWVRQRAYALYEARGGVDGQDQDDWLKAEAEWSGTQGQCGESSH